MDTRKPIPTFISIYNILVRFFKRLYLPLLGNKNPLRVTWPYSFCIALEFSTCFIHIGWINEWKKINELMRNEQTHTRNILVRNDRCVNSSQLCRQVWTKFSFKISKCFIGIHTSILKIYLEVTRHLDGEPKPATNKPTSWRARALELTSGCSSFPVSQSVQLN